MAYRVPGSGQRRTLKAAALPAHVKRSETMTSKGKLAGASGRSGPRRSPRAVLQLGATIGTLALGRRAALGQSGEPHVAMFRDATEILFAVADGRRLADPGAPWVPHRHFVMDANEAHQIALEGPYPMVGMSLDDLLECSRSSHPSASELVAFMGVHRGFLRLVASRDIKKISDLKGRRLAVDTDTGYASALFEILRQHGLERGCDFEVVYAGATNLRYDKLLQGEFDATLLGAPFTRLAIRQGYPSLGTVIDALGGYQAIVLVARRPWLAQNATIARAVTTCLRQAFQWAARSENREMAESFMRDSMLGGEPSAIGQVSEDLFGSSTEFLTDGHMREADTRVVIDLFNASRGAAITQQTVKGLTDLSCLD